MASDDGAARVPIGPVGRNVTANLSLLRARLSYRDLAARLGQLGRPIPPLGLSRIEKGNRRVDADDLVALALALGVTPNRLLLPKGAGTDPVELTSAVTVTARRAWQWATGERYLDPGEAGGLEIPREADFLRENRPHDMDYTVGELLDLEEKHRDVLAEVGRAVRAAEAAGVPRGAIRAWLDVNGAVARLQDAAKAERAGRE